MSICASCNNFWISSVFIIAQKMEYGIWEYEPSDKLIFCWVVEVQKFIICSNTKYFWVLYNGNVDDTVNYNSTESYILNRFVCLFLKYDNILFIIFQQSNHLSVFQWKYFFCRKLKFIQMLVSLKVTFLSFWERFLTVNQVVCELFKFYLINAED